MADWPFGDLTPFKYGAILVDPPWAYTMYSQKGYSKSPEAHYETMGDDAIRGLPVGHLASQSALLVLCAIWPRLPFALDLMAVWGFQYVTGGTWVKTTVNGKIRWGTGYVLRSGCEPFLVGRIGPRQPSPRNVLNVIMAQAREHSRKPAELRQMVEKMTPGVYRCELFARESWAGNETWGKETGRFDTMREALV
jgi:N6-adenosine-specific RNA methylase IME4